MELNIPWDKLLSFVIGGSLTTFIARIVIQKSLAQLDMIADALHTIQIKLATIEVSTKDLDMVRKNMIDQSLKLVELDTKLKGVLKCMNSRPPLQ